MLSTINQWGNTALKLALLSFALKAGAQDEVTVFLEPNEQSVAFDKVSLEALNALKPTPYPEAQPTGEWLLVNYPGDYVGYVEPAYVNKDLTVRKGAPIQLEPRSLSDLAKA